MADQVTVQTVLLAAFTVNYKSLSISYDTCIIYNYYIYIHVYISYQSYHLTDFAWPCAFLVAACPLVAHDAWPACDGAVQQGMSFMMFHGLFLGQRVVDPDPLRM